MFSVPQSVFQADLYQCELSSVQRSALLISTSIDHAVGLHERESCDLSLINTKEMLGAIAIDELFWYCSYRDW